MKWHFPRNFLWRSNREANTIKGLFSFFPPIPTHRQAWTVTPSQHYSFVFVKRQIIDLNKTAGADVELACTLSTTNEERRCSGRGEFGKLRRKSKTEWSPTCSSGMDTHSEKRPNRYAPECQSARQPRQPGSRAGLSWPPYVWLFICLFLAHFEVIFTLRALKKKAANVANHTTCLFFFNKSMLGWTENKCKFCVVSGFGGFCTPPLFSPIWLDLVLMENIFSGFPSVLWLPCLDYCWFKKLCPDEHMSLLYVSNNVDLSGLRQGLRQLILLFLAEYVIHCSDE